MQQDQLNKLIDIRINNENRYKDIITIINESIESLHPKQKEVFIKKYLENKRDKNIAIEMNISSGTVCYYNTSSKNSFLKNFIKKYENYYYLNIDKDLLKWININSFFNQTNKLVFWLYNLSSNDLVYKKNIAKKLNTSVETMYNKYYWPIILYIEEYWGKDNILINRKDRTEKELAEEIGINYSIYRKYIDNFILSEEYNLKNYKLGIVEIVENI